MRSRFARTPRAGRPLLPPNVRDAVTITRTGIEAFRVVTGFLKVIQTGVAAIGEIPKAQPEKSK